ncbi:hypothetical protein ACFQ3K_14735 [Brucella gallinifaecis]|uniref:Uncharacterized protein n=1 Tax=Brucella gallinifaecis TaxID=215590 RepID=A0A502BUH2_9HYPH|nr:hypothetical protein [Brucella gallinifaecis]TPF76718.1 hypothetical protein FHY56_04285 [Brucella gallinifaecis]
MNHFAAYVQKVPRGYRVMVRFAQHGRPNPILCKGGAPIVYPTKLEATEEALKHLLAYMNNEYLRVGETASSARTEAEKLFPSLQPIRKNGKVIQVERKRAAA